MQIKDCVTLEEVETYELLQERKDTLAMESLTKCMIATIVQTLQAKLNLEGSLEEGEYNLRTMSPNITTDSKSNVTKIEYNKLDTYCVCYEITHTRTDIGKVLKTTGSTFLRSDAK